MVRSILAIAAGLITAFVVIFVIEAIGHVFYPPPPDADMRNQETVKNLMENAPAGSLIIVLVGWALGSFVGGVVSSHIASGNKVIHSIIVGALLMVSGIANMIMLPHPLWMWIFGLMIFIPFAYLGNRFLNKNKIPE